MSEPARDTTHENTAANAESAAPESAATESAATESAATEKSGKIDFDRAEFDKPAGDQVACDFCHREITTEYWQYLGKVLCDGCRGGVHSSVADAGRGVTFGKALLVGGGTALACGVGYAIFVRLSNIHFALVTIGIGWAVGRAIQRVTRGFGSTRHQVLAVALTYFASTMGYLPAVIDALRKGAQTDQTASDGKGTPSAGQARPDLPPPVAGAPDVPQPPTASSPSSPPEGGARPSLALALIVVAGISTAFMLAAPFLEISSGFSGLLGALIIFFGLRTAWRVAKGVNEPMTGPHQVAARATP